MRRPATDLLIIAFGNELRGDDGAAHHVVHLLEADSRFQGLMIETHQLTPDLAEAVASSRVVCFVDARIPDGDGSVSVTRIEAEFAAPASLGHTMSPEELLTVARVLYSGAPQAWLIGIPSESFELGAPLSETALTGVSAAVRAIRTIASSVLSAPDEGICTS